MKKTVFTFALFFATLINMYAQYSATPFDSKDIIRFNATKKTFGILTGDVNYDNALKAALTEQWKLTPIDYVSWEDFEKNYNTPENAFIIPCGYSYNKKKNKFNGDGEYQYLALFNGTDKKWNKFTYDDVVAYCPLDYFSGTEFDLVSSYKRMPLLIAGLINAVTLVKEQKIAGNSLSMVNKMKDIYNKDAKTLKNKTLLINSDRRPTVDVEDIKKVYPYNFEYVPSSKIEEAIKNKDPKYAIYVTAATRNKSMFVYDAATYKCIYADYQMTGFGVKAKDFEDVAEKIQGKK